MWFYLTLFVAVSQSGETADTLSALIKAKEQKNYIGTLAISNAPHSSIVRESQLAFITKAGTEIGVASTKTFTSLLAALFVLTFAIDKCRNSPVTQVKEICPQLADIPALVNEILLLEPSIINFAKQLATKPGAYFLGRGIYYPIAMEGALKLKEISYIHAEAYAAGELKHGPLALIDKGFPVIVTAPHDSLLPKVKANISEIKARGGKLFIFTEEGTDILPEENLEVLLLPKINQYIAPMAYTIPFQLLAYHTAVLRGTDLDRPRNLAKAVTVE